MSCCCYRSLTLTDIAIGWSIVCDCDISWSYSLHLNDQTPAYLSGLIIYISYSYSFRYTNAVEVPQVKTSTSALLLLKCRIPCLNNSGKLHQIEHLRSRIGIWNSGGGLHMFNLFKLLMFMFIFVVLNVESSVN